MKRPRIAFIYPYHPSDIGQGHFFRYANGVTLWFWKIGIHLWVA